MPWHDRNISAGTDWEREIDAHLNTADLILLLISSDFIASTYCSSIEAIRAMERHEKGEARVIPVILRPTDWQGVAFERLQALPTNAKPITTWPNRDQAFLNVAQGIRKAIEELQGKRPGVHASPLSVSISTHQKLFPSIWNVPYPRNPFFTGREELLAQLMAALRTGSATALTQPQAISGLGGIGKTQIAVEYAYRSHANYQAVFWVHADTRENVVSDFVTIAGLLKLPERNAQDQMIVVNAVKEWLRMHGQWLLILDNADDLAMVQEFMPLVHGGHVLLTTRAAAMGRLAQRLEVEKLDVDVGALFLLRRASILAPDGSLEQASPRDRESALAITREMDGLPLALDQAGAYIEETPCSVEGYLRLYRRQRGALLVQRGGLVDDHPASVATTWSLSFEQVEKNSPAAADLLRVCAFLHPDAIPEELLSAGALHLGPQLEPLAVDELAFNEAIRALHAYSLVRRDLPDKTLSVHRLVQAVLRDAMNEETQRLWAERVVRAVNAAFPKVEFATWQRCQHYLPHALACDALIESYHLTFPEAARLLDRAAWYLEEHAQYVQAEPLNQRALAIREKVLPPDHPDTSTSLNNLAHLYGSQGRYEEAEPLYQRALAIYEQARGPEHPETAATLDNLAQLYQAQGRYEEAEPFYQRALAIREKALGLEHPSTSITLNNLANLYRSQGHYEEAEPLYQRSLAIKEKALGPEHPETAFTLNNLAYLYQAQGRYEEAEALYQRALAIKEKALPPEHPSIAIALKNYADLLRKMKRTGEAATFEQRAKAIRGREASRRNI
ncbi:MAG: FxSxx-COOH system tetratricopeptide repeat protein [Ktedonobacteraceae bacterium]